VYCQLILINIQVNIWAINFDECVDNKYTSHESFLPRNPIHIELIFVPAIVIVIYCCIYYCYYNKYKRRK